MTMKKFILILNGIDECYTKQDIQNSLKVMGISAEVEEEKTTSDEIKCVDV